MSEDTSDRGPFRFIDITLIDEPVNPTRFASDDAGIADLAQSIHSLGLLEPIVVTPTGERYRLIAGQRRLAAVRLLGQDAISAHVLDVLPHDEALATITENLQRSQLSALEEAVALQTLLDNHALTQAELATRLGAERTWISHRLQLLRLQEDLQDAMVHNDLPPSHALELSRITDDDSRRYYLDICLSAGASLTTVRQWVRQWLTYQPGETSPAPPPPTSVELPPAPPQALPACLVCGEAPPRVQLRMAYLCWTCERALRLGTSGEGDHEKHTVDPG